MNIELRYASSAIEEAVNSIGRTEDVRFSPDNKRLAVAGFAKNEVTVLGLETSATSVTLTSSVRLSSQDLKKPHGLDFIDNETIIVANREGGLAVFKIPAPNGDSAAIYVDPLRVWESDVSAGLKSPGSVSVGRGGLDEYEALVCNNYVDTVTRHWLSRTDLEMTRSEILLRKWLHIPDSITVSHDGRWIAVSVHGTHSVFLYENTPSLSTETYPAGVLRGLSFPHGLRFSIDDRRLIVADAGSTNVHLYAMDGDGWAGVHHPRATVAVMDYSTFLRGHINPEEGGPKGIDFSQALNLLAVTTEFQTLRFFSLQEILGPDDLGEANDKEPPSRHDRNVLDVERELNVMELEYKAVEEALALMRNSMSWKVTSPLRDLSAAVRDFRKRLTHRR